MATYLFSSLVHGQHLAFDAGADTLFFDLGSITAGAVRVFQSGANLGFSYGGKTVWLDFTLIGQVSLTNVGFANGSLLAIGDGTIDQRADHYGADYGLGGSDVGQQAWGLGGADIVRTGGGADWLVGNVALKPLNHVSSSAGAGSPTPSHHATISADGRHVAFAGGWTAFGSTDNSGTDVFVKDLDAGSVSDEHRSAAGVNGLSGSGFPVISADGRYLVFQSSSGLVPGTPPSGTLYVSTVAGNAIEAVSTTSGGAYADRAASNPDISADGRYVVFSSTATNLAPGSTSATEDVFLKDRVTGEVTRLSTAVGSGDGNGDSQFAKVSADGRLVVFQSFASNLVANDTNGQADIFMWDRSNGSLTNITKDLPVVSNAGNGNFLPDVAVDGIWGGVIVFETARNLLPADDASLAGSLDVYAYNVHDGSLQLVSSKADGNGVALSSQGASASGDGRFVSFTGYADDLVGGDANGQPDIFVKDLIGGEIALVSRSAAGASGNGASTRSQVSLGGEWIVFESTASNLAASDANGSMTDVFRVSNPLLRDTLVGGAGNDTYVLARADFVQEAPGGGIDTIVASLGYSLVDTDGSGTLGGNVENLTLAGSSNLAGTGNALDNVISGNAGHNAMNGGAGIDTVSYAQATAAVSVSLAISTAQATGGAGSDTLSGFENLTGSAYDDRLNGSAAANRLDGGAGNDTLTGGAGDDTYVVGSSGDVIVEGVGAGTDTVLSSITWTLQGTLEHLTLTGSAAIHGSGNSAANRLTGNAAANQLSGAAGNDTLNGAGGADTMTGGDGNDIAYVDHAGDLVVETNAVAATGGNDAVYSSLAAYTLGANVENLRILSPGSASATGNALNNYLYAGAGNNTLDGAAGNDTASYFHAAAAVNVSLAIAGAQATGGSGSDTLVAIENLIGSSLNDRLTGNAGANTLTGGSGSDTMTGGAGADLFVLSSLVGSDTITDFASGSDRIRVQQSAIAIGDGDLLLEGATAVAGPGGFAPSAELVIVTANIAGSINTISAAAAIGSATSAYAVGAKALFVVDSGVNSALLLFTAADANATVAAAELRFLAALGGTPSTGLADFVFG